MSMTVLRRGAAALALMVAAGTGLTAGTASATEAGVQGFKCGYDKDTLGINAYYTHCDPQTYVVIEIWGEPWVEDEMCVGPGTTKLGLAYNYTFAAYAGRLC